MSPEQDEVDAQWERCSALFGDPAAAAPSRRGISITVSLVSLTVAATVVAGLSIWGTMLGLNQAGLDATTLSVQQQTATNLMASTREYTAPYIYATQSLSEYLRVGTQNDPDLLRTPSKWLPVCFSLTKSLVPHCFVGYPDGGVAGYRRYLNETRNAIAITVTNGSSLSTSETTSRGSASTLISFVPSFNVTSRLWFKGARETGALYISPVEVSANIIVGGTRTGISVSIPVFRDLQTPHFSAGKGPVVYPWDDSVPSVREVVAVAMVGVALEHLALVLQETKLGTSGKALAWYFDDSGTLIATSSANIPLSNGSNVMKIPDVPNALIKTTMLALLDEAGVSATDYSGGYSRIPKFWSRVMQVNTEKMIVTVADYRVLDPSFNWTLVVAIPYSDYFGQLELAQKLSLVIIFACIVPVLAITSAIFSVLFLSRPAKELASCMTAVTKGFVFRERQPGRLSLVTEIATMQQSYDSMERALLSFSKFAPMETVRQILQASKEANLTVNEVEATAFFSDIEGFTAISEALRPHQLILLLEDYFGAMIDIVERGKGTIGDLIGDSVFAFWNTPVSVGPAHALLAVDAAVRQQRLLEILRADWAKRDLPCIRVRIGIHTGKCLAGNVGSKTRLKFTLVGDMVNLASRLEGLCKLYRVYLLITEDVYESPGVKDEFCVQFLDRVSVAGKTDSTVVMTVLCRRNEATWNQLRLEAQSRRILDHYCNGQLGECVVVLSEMLALFPENFGLQSMLERCASELRDCTNGTVSRRSGVRKLSEK